MSAVSQLSGLAGPVTVEDLSQKPSSLSLLSTSFTPGSSEEDFFAKLDEAVAAIRLYQPDVLILTLGFDIYKNDPQAKVSVTSEGFCRLSTHLRQLGLPTLVVQEGGYDLDALSENVQQFFKGLEG